jgi:hypothetical protein
LGQLTQDTLDKIAAAADGGSDGLDPSLEKAAAEVGATLPTRCSTSLKTRSPVGSTSAIIFTETTQRNTQTVLTLS